MPPPLDLSYAFHADRLQKPEIKEPPWLTECPVVTWHNNCLEELSAIVIRILDKNNNLSTAYLRNRFGLTDEETYSLIHHLLDMGVIKLLPITLSQWGVSLSEDGKKFLHQVYKDIAQQKIDAMWHLVRILQKKNEK